MILLLAGTSDARRLAGRLAEADVPTLASLAGAVREPQRLPVPTRIGGFGGEAGFLRVLDREGIAAVIDATHPFAARITERTHRLCAAHGVPLVRLERPGWSPGPGDLWTVVADVTEAAARLPPDAVAFLATGRQSLPDWVASFRGKRAHLRVIDPPDAPFPLPGSWVVGRPPFDATAEAATFRALGVTHLVAKDSGGTEGRGKLDAARALGLPVILLRRPPPPEGLRTVATVDDALAWALDAHRPVAVPFRPMRIIHSDACVAEGAAWLAAHDPRFHAALTRVGPLPLRRTADGFDRLLAAIVSQQVSVAAARAIWGRMEAAGLTTPEAVLAADEETLRAPGLSRQKVRYAKALAAEGIDFDALRDQPTEAVVKRLVAVPGIGVWTAEVYAMFALGHADVFAPGDLALQEGARMLLGLPERPSEKALRAMAAEWSPWRSVAARLLWAHYAAEKAREGVA